MGLVALARRKATRLWTPRARAAEPGRGPNLRLVYTRPPPLRAPQPGAQEQTRGGERNGIRYAKKKHMVHTRIGIAFRSNSVDRETLARQLFIIRTVNIYRREAPPTHSGGIGVFAYYYYAGGVRFSGHMPCILYVRGSVGA